MQKRWGELYSEDVYWQKVTRKLQVLFELCKCMKFDCGWLAVIRYNQGGIGCMLILLISSMTCYQTQLGLQREIFTPLIFLNAFIIARDPQHKGIYNLCRELCNKCVYYFNCKFKNKSLSMHLSFEDNCDLPCLFSCSISGIFPFIWTVP